MKSLFDTGAERYCQICGATRALETHHIFGGPFRKKSDRYGLTITLCHSCHNEPPWGVHYNRPTADGLKARAQEKAMEAYGWTTADFIREFGKNYIDRNER